MVRITPSDKPSQDATVTDSQQLHEADAPRVMSQSSEASSWLETQDD
ncbi:MAG: hypothetical protein H6822_24890 [Planctomycetaceae bacterium]|nr:hypothetical protein [Planctomycetales bacterium]MCB9925414.1 hypothetical protein [Planctomycetaceae bacterium]